MRNILLAVFVTATGFLGLSTYMQAKGTMVINPVYVSQQDQDQLSAYLTAQQVQGEQ